MVLSDEDSSKDKLSYASLLLMYSAPVVPNSYFPDANYKTGSFMLSKKLYNTVNGNKDVESSKKKPPTLISMGRVHQDNNFHSRMSSPSLYTKYKVLPYLM